MDRKSSYDKKWRTALAALTSTPEGRMCLLETIALVFAIDEEGASSFARELHALRDGWGEERVVRQQRDFLQVEDSDRESWFGLRYDVGQVLGRYQARSRVAWGYYRVELVEKILLVILGGPVADGSGTVEHGLLRHSNLFALAYHVIERQPPDVQPLVRRGLLHTRLVEYFERGSA